MTTNNTLLKIRPFLILREKKIYFLKDKKFKIKIKNVFIFVKLKFKNSFSFNLSLICLVVSIHFLG